MVQKPLRRPAARQRPMKPVASLSRFFFFLSSSSEVGEEERCPSRVWHGHEPSSFLACTPRLARVLRHINPEAKSPVTCRSIAGPRPSRSPRPRTSLLLASLRAPCPLEHSAAARKPSAQVFPADPTSRIPSQPVLLRVGAESPGLQRSGLLLEPYTSPSVMALGNHEHKGPGRNILSHSFSAIDHRRRLRADHGRLFLTRFQAL
ncbi:hypothetical protein PVAP13_8NG105102 [Panicum virgatum]|uniref:Uncharacterized protein n=1 Tax=Panicum virgatum TaxID=38727 RepID=A0A8T0P8R1_PANVG|nr:hypothetical protein PVAP13_8NG105102 [Panicum virgatum]KAG2557998.1 hypothetical protein PVAP13_8NG105102 [Panicum virgatum]KAG2557999.1 hypothetical protein PVAP13_8NG105102 [Panicum virgatum]KAG2558000.1 hypothetical protein PVAP13_8NG105102 [Panicum virgatum]